MLADAIDVIETVVIRSDEEMLVHPLLIGQLLALLGFANGTPLMVKKVLGPVLARPIDGGAVLTDGQPLFGASKTIRGVASSLALTALAAPVVGLSWKIGFVVSASAMGGDLFSSFAKRRMKLEASSMALGLDQVPESFLPALACRPLLHLSGLDIMFVTALFFCLELILSRALYTLNLRDRPY